VACEFEGKVARPQAAFFFFALHGAKVDGNAFPSRCRVARQERSPLRAKKMRRRRQMPPSVAWIRVREAAQGAGNYGGKLFLGSRPRLLAACRRHWHERQRPQTTSLIDAIIKASGAKTGLFGTIAYHTPLKDYPAPNTTPESVEPAGIFSAEIRDGGADVFAVLEATFAFIGYGSLVGLPLLRRRVFTNLTARATWTYHKTFEDYFAAKLRLFEGTGAGAPEDGRGQHR